MYILVTAISMWAMTVLPLNPGVEKAKYRVACENITITNCTMVHGHGGVVIGSE